MIIMYVSLYDNDHYAWYVGVSAGDGWHDAGVCHALLTRAFHAHQSVRTINPSLTIAKVETRLKATQA